MYAGEDSSILTEENAEAAIQTAREELGAVFGCVVPSRAASRPEALTFAPHPLGILRKTSRSGSPGRSSSWSWKGRPW